MIPARGLIGFQTEFRTITAGTGLLFHVFDHYGPKAEGDIGQRQNGVLISNGTGPSPAYAQIAMQERGRLMVEPGEQVYVGMIIGENARENDIPVNAVREKKLTNMRSQGDGKGIQLNAPLKLTLERALEYIDVDEYVEATPHHLRLRKKILDENARKRSEKSRVIKFVEDQATN